MAYHRLSKMGKGRSYCDLTTDEDLIVPKLESTWYDSLHIRDLPCGKYGTGCVSNDILSSSAVIDLVSDEDEAPKKKNKNQHRPSEFGNRPPVPQSEKQLPIDVNAEHFNINVSHSGVTLSCATDELSAPKSPDKRSQRGLEAPSNIAPVVNMVPTADTSAGTPVIGTSSLKRRTTTQLESDQDISGRRNQDQAQKASCEKFPSQTDDRFQRQVEEEVKRRIDEEKKRSKYAVTTQEHKIEPPPTKDDSNPMMEDTGQQPDKLKRGFAALANLRQETTSTDNNGEQQEPAVWKKFYCPRCNLQLSKRSHVKRHFDNCIRKRGNPDKKAWDSHPSCQQTIHHGYDPRSARGSALELENESKARPCGGVSSIDDPEEDGVDEDAFSGMPAGGSTSESKAFQCPICNSKFADRHNVKRHFDSCVARNGNPEGLLWDDHPSCHLERKPTLVHRCPICNRTCTRPNQVKAHFSSCVEKHGNPNGVAWDSCLSVPPRESEERQLPRCPVCHATFNCHNTVKKHLRNVHGLSEAQISALAEDDPEQMLSPGRRDRNNASAQSPHQRSHKSNKKSSTDLAVLKPNRKRTLNDISIGTLYEPKQVVSRKELERYAEAKRQKLEKRWHSEAQKKEEEACNKDEKSGPADTTSDEGTADHVPAVPNVQKTDSRATDTHHAGTSLRRIRDSSRIVNQQSKLQCHAVSSKQTPNPPPKAPSNEPDPSATPQRSLSSEGSQLSWKVSRQNRRSFVPDAPPAEIPKTPSDRPTTGSKGISAATLAAWEAQEQEAEGEELETPETLYIYLVLLRNWHASEEEAFSKTMGPYYTVEEANAVAGEEVKYPLERPESIDAYNPRAKHGWSYTFSEDENKMQKHGILLAGGWQMEAVVQRGNASPPPKTPPPQ